MNEFHVHTSLQLTYMLLSRMSSKKKLSWQTEDWVILNTESIVLDNLYAIWRRNLALPEISKVKKR